MKSFYLPKEFDKNTEILCCCATEHGKSSTDVHWHSGAEIIFMNKGTSSVFFNGEWFSLKENSMLFIPPKQPHCCKCCDENAEKTIIGFLDKCIDSDNFEFNFPAEITRYCIIDELDKTPVTEWIQSFSEHATKKSFDHRLIAKAEILKIYAFLVSYWEKHGLNTDETNVDKLVLSTRKYIAKNYTENISPYEFAKLINVSYSYLSKKLHDEGEESFIRMVNRTRVEEAKRQLCSTDESITAIGYNCGFCDSSYFIKIFRSITGLTPKEYRNASKNSPKH